MVDEADGYRVYYKTRLKRVDRLRWADSFADVPFAITGLDNDTTYNVVVTAVVNKVKSACSIRPRR